MRGFGQTTSFTLVGWLWADILLGLFALFLAANTSASSASVQTTPGVDPKDIEISLPVDAQTLLHGTPDAIATEQARIADAPAKAATAQLTLGAFDGSTVKPFHELAPNATGQSITLDVYLFY